MKKKILGTILAVSCILPATVLATDIEIVEQEDEITIVGGSVTLNFNSNGGTECSSMTLPVASTPTTYELPIPMKAGHTFKGWFTEDGKQITGENPFDAFDIVVADKTATVKAKWEKQEVLTVTSSITREEIENSEEYYDIVHRTENFADGSKIVINTKTRKIEEYVIEEMTTYIYYNQDGSTTQEAYATYNGYSEYQKATAKNDLTVNVVDVNGKPVEGFEINFKTTEEDINLKTDKDGKIVHLFKPGTYESKVVTIPSGYALNQQVEKLGYGKIYSISYVENYVLDIVKIGEPPKQEEKNENVIIKEEKIDKDKDENKNDKKDEPKKEEIKVSTSSNTTNVVANIQNTNIKENSDPVNTEIVPAPQTADNTSFLFLGLIPISLGILYKKKKH